MEAGNLGRTLLPLSPADGTIGLLLSWSPAKWAIRVSQDSSFPNHDFLYSLFARRKIPLDHIPEYDQIDPKVLRHDDIFEPSRQDPHGSWLFPPKIRRQRSASLADDHQMMNDPGLKEFFTRQSFLPADRILLDPIKLLQEHHRAAPDHPS